MDIQTLVERLKDMKHHPDCICLDCMTITETIKVLKDIDARDDIDYFKGIL